MNTPACLRRGLLPGILAVAALALAGCQTVQTTEAGTVEVERKQQMLISEEQVQAAASEAYARELEAAREKGQLNADRTLAERVRATSRRLIPQTRVFRDDAPGWNWEINTLDTEELNAYAMPGGKIMVYTGLIERLKLSDAELAAVIGHEIAHALREHSRERISRAYAQQLALAGVAVATGAGEQVLNLANMVATVTFQLPHSREQEAEADVIGLELMARAGFDPNAAPRVWEKMMAVDKNNPPQFLSTHPSPQTRIEALKSLVPKVTPLYKASGARWTRPPGAVSAPLKKFHCRGPLWPFIAPAA